MNLTDGLEGLLEELQEHYDTVDGPRIGDEPRPNFAMQMGIGLEVEIRRINAAVGALTRHRDELASDLADARMALRNLLPNDS